MSIKDKISAAVESLKKVLATRTCSVSWSAGKDSSVILGLTLQAALALKKEGVSMHQIIVTHGDTTVENPEIRAYADSEIRKIVWFALEHGLPLEVAVARPSLSESWQCRVIGGRALPSFPGMNHDCTTEMKIQPMGRLKGYPIFVIETGS